MSDGTDGLLPPRLSPDERSGKGVYCPHCGKVYATDGSACPRCPPPEGPFAPGPCPRCEGLLAATAAGSTSVGRCARCGGTWIDRGAVFLALDMRTCASSGGPTLADVRRTMPAAPPEDPAAKRHPPCPRCCEPMSRRLAAPLSSVSPEFCAPHGMWFDSGQYEHFGAFVAAGGLELSRREIGREAAEEALSERSARQVEIERARRSRRGGGGISLS